MSTTIPTSDPMPADSRPAPRADGSSHRLGGAVLALGGLAFLVGILVVPGPDAADIRDATWVPGHALNAVGFLLMALGLPSLAGSLGRRLGALGAVGYGALMVRCVLSTGSHVYSMWIMPRLAEHPDLHDALRSDGPHGVASIYASYGDAINIAISIGILGLVVALARLGRGFRTAAVLLGLGAVAESIGTPIGLGLFAVVAAWFGLRLAVRDDVRRPLRTPKEPDAPVAV